MADSFFGGLAEGIMNARQAKRQQALDIAAQVWKEKDFQQNQQQMEFAHDIALKNNDTKAQALLMKQMDIDWQEKFKTSKEASDEALKSLTEKLKERNTDSLIANRLTLGDLHKAQASKVNAETPLIPAMQQSSIARNIALSLQAKATAEDKLADIGLKKVQAEGIKQQIDKGKATTEEIKQHTKNLGQQYQFNKEANPLKIKEMNIKLQELDQKVKSFDPQVYKDQKIATLEATRMLTRTRSETNANAVIKNMKDMQAASNTAYLAAEKANNEHFNVYSTKAHIDDFLKNSPDMVPDSHGVMIPAMIMVSDMNGKSKAIGKKEAKILSGAYEQQLSHLSDRIAALQENQNVMHNISDTMQREANKRGIYLQQTSDGKNIHTSNSPSSNTNAGNEHLGGFQTGNRSVAPPAPTKVRVRGTDYEWSAIDGMTPAQMHQKFTPDEIRYLIAANKKRAQ